MSDEKDDIGWAIVELMGHRRIAGYVTEQEIAGAAFLRVDIPSRPAVTQIYSAAAIYCITPADEHTAREAALIGRVAPLHRWELPAAAASTAEGYIEH